MEHGVELDAVNQAGETALLVACRAGENRVDACCWDLGTDEDYCEIVHCLLRAGCTVDRAAKNGRTPLMYASWLRSLACMELLLRAGADPQRTNLAGTTAFDFAGEDARRVALLEDFS